MAPRYGGVARGEADGVKSMAAAGRVNCSDCKKTKTDETPSNSVRSSRRETAQWGISAQFIFKLAAFIAFPTLRGNGKTKHRRLTVDPPPGCRHRKERTHRRAANCLNHRNFCSRDFYNVCRNVVKTNPYRKHGRPGLTDKGSTRDPIPYRPTCTDQVLYGRKKACTE